MDDSDAGCGGKGCWGQARWGCARCWGKFAESEMPGASVVARRDKLEGRSHVVSKTLCLNKSTRHSPFTRDSIRTR
jgi:hypothetical protein